MAQEPNPPTPAAEPGSSTSELKVLIATAVIDTVQLVVAFGVHLTAQQQFAIITESGILTALAMAYIVGRSVRKIGTGG